MKCIRCGARAYSEYCFRCKPRKPIKTNVMPKKVGKVTKSWLAARKQWLDEHPQEQYRCFVLWCPDTVTREHATLGHDKSRVRHPELRAVQSNIRGHICDHHNREMGSMDSDQYIALLKEKGTLFLENN